MERHHTAPSQCMRMFVMFLRHPIYVHITNKRAKCLRCASYKNLNQKPERQTLPFSVGALQQMAYCHNFRRWPAETNSWEAIWSSVSGRDINCIPSKSLILQRSVSIAGNLAFSLRAPMSVSAGNVHLNVSMTSGWHLPVGKLTSRGYHLGVVLPSQYTLQCVTDKRTDRLVNLLKLCIVLERSWGYNHGW